MKPAQIRNQERGQAFVETGLMLMIVLPIVIGIMDFGQFLYFHQALSDRTRAAARWAAVNTFDATQITNVAIYNDPNGSANGASRVLPHLNNTTAGSNGYVSATLSDAGTDDARVTVTITNFPYNFLLMPSSLNYRTIYDTEPYEIGR
jgi:Flp pilus assembly protein TadG